MDGWMNRLEQEGEPGQTTEALASAASTEDEEKKIHHSIIGNLRNTLSEERQ